MAAKSLEAAFERDPNTAVRAEALKSLGEMRADGALDRADAALALASPDDRLRHAAIEALGRLRHDEAARRLVTWTGADKPKALRMRALASLGRCSRGASIGGKSVIECLEDPDSEIRQAASAAAAAMGLTSALSRIQTLARDEPLDRFGSSTTYASSAAELLLRGLTPVER
jgi:HEAT repeat protein